MIEVVVDNRLRVSLAELPAAVAERLRTEFTHTNPARSKLEAMGVRGYALHKEPKFIATWRIDSRGALTLPRGGMGRLRGAMLDASLDWSVSDERTEGDRELAGRIPPHRLPNGGSLYDFQEDIVREAMATENCIVRSPTGSGKTTALLALASRINLPTLVVVWTGGLLKQWVERAMQELGLREDEVGVIGGGTRRIRPLTIGMQQTLAKHALAVRDLFGVVLPDELQKFAAHTFLDVVDVMPARYRVGSSANERRKDRKEFLIYDEFGDVAVDVSQDELIAQGIVHDVEIRVVRTEFDAPWYRDLMDRSRDGQDILRDKRVQKERLLAFERLTDEMTDDRARCALAVQLAVDAVAAGEQVVLLSHRREQCRVLAADVAARGIECGLMLGGVDSVGDYERARGELLAGRMRACVGTYQAIGQGIDLPSVGVGICCSPVANSADNMPFFTQVRGRFCRASAETGKAGAALYYLLDEQVYGKRPVRHLRRWNRRVFVLSRGGSWVEARAWLKQEDDE